MTRDTSIATWRRPSVIPGFGLTFGFTLTYLSLIVLIPLAALILRTTALTLGPVLGHRHQRPRGCRAAGLLRRVAPRRDDQCGVRADRRLGAGALPFPRPPRARRHRRSSVRAARPPSPASRSPRSSRRPAGSGSSWSRSASRSPIRGSASSSRSPSSACRSWSARCSRSSRKSTARPKKPRRRWARPPADHDARDLPDAAAGPDDRLRARAGARRRRVRLGHLHRRQHAVPDRDRAAADRHPARRSSTTRARPPSPP